MTIQLKFGGIFPVGFRLLSFQTITDFAEKFARLFVAQCLKRRVINVVKSKWFHNFLLVFLLRLFYGFPQKPSLNHRRSPFAHTKKPADLSASFARFWFRDVLPYKSNGNTRFMHTFKNFLKNFYSEFILINKRQSSFIFNNADVTIEEGGKNR